MVSDLCKVNKQLALEIQGMIGSECFPGQAFYNLHFTLAINQCLLLIDVTLELTLR